MRRMGIGLGVGINRSNYAQGLFNAYSSRVTADGGVVESGSCVDAVSSLLQSASLLLIPSGYKGGKLYAEIPTNGNGDLTWTRGGTANRTNASGNIELMGANVPRLSYMYGSCPSALLEPQRTNLALRSEEFDNASWSKVASSITSNSTTAHDGNTTADTITDNSTPSVHTADQNVSNAGTYTFSVYAKKGTLNFVGLCSTQSGQGAFFNINTGAFSSNIVNAPTSNSITNVGNGWYRCAITTTTTSSSQFRIMMSNDGTSFTYVGSGQSIFIWGAQLEAGAYPTTYIPTTSATATRVADSFSRNNIYTNGLISASGGTWFVEFKGNNPKIRDGFMTFGLTDVASNNGFYFNQSSGVNQRLTLNYYLGGIATTNVFSTTTDNVKLAIKWNGSTADIFQNGVKVVSNISFTFTQMQILNCSGLGIPTFIQQMALFPTPLSDTDCTTITTL